MTSVLFLLHILQQYFIKNPFLSELCSSNHTPITSPLNKVLLHKVSPHTGYGLQLTNRLYSTQAQVKK